MSCINNSVGFRLKSLIYWKNFYYINDSNYSYLIYNNYKFIAFLEALFTVSSVRKIKLNKFLFKAGFFFSFLRITKLYKITYIFIYFNYSFWLLFLNKFDNIKDKRNFFNFYRKLNFSNRKFLSNLIKKKILLYTKSLIFKFKDLYFLKSYLNKNRLLHNIITKFWFLKKKRFKNFLLWKDEEIVGNFLKNGKRGKKKLIEKKKNNFFIFFGRYLKFIYNMYYLAFPYFFFLKRFIKSTYEIFFLKNIFNSKKNNRWTLDAHFNSFLNIYFVIRKAEDISSSSIIYFILGKIANYYKLPSILNSINKILQLYIKYNLIFGYKILCKGRFSRKDRAAYVWHSFKIPLNTKFSSIDFSWRNIVLKYSICIIKIWICK